MIALAAVIASPRTTIVSLGFILGLGVLGTGIVLGQMLERERPACWWPR